MEPNYVAPTLFEPLLALDIRVPPREFRIFAAGENETEKGNYLFDDKAADSVMDAWGRRKIDLTMDYEHQALAVPPIEAPASCTRWVPQIRNGELWATECKWTDRAFSYLCNGEYRYISPAFAFEEKSLRITEVLNLALTNIPAMRGIAPLVAATQRKEKAVDYEKLYKDLQAQFETLNSQLVAKEAQIAELTAAKATSADQQKEVLAEVQQLTATLSLPATARSTDRTAAIAGLTSLRTNVMTLTGATSEAHAIGTIHAWKDSHGRVAQLTARVQELEEEQNKKDFDALLEEAGKNGKLEPAKREEVRTQLLSTTGGRCTKETVGIARVALSLRPAAVNAGNGTPPPAGGGGMPDPIEAHIAKVCGRDLTAASPTGK